MPTIELCVERALRAADVVHSGATLQQINFSRASRTDKGVSAMCNAFGANLLFTEADLTDKTSWIERVNSHLPAEIRIWTVLRVRGSFNAKDAPDSRSYDYVAPVFVLLPRRAVSDSTDKEKPENDDAKLQRVDESFLERINQFLLYFLGTNNFHNYTKG